MRSSAETKIMIVLVVSLIAFGLGSGIGISMAMSQDSPFDNGNDTIKEVPVNITEENQKNSQIQENTESQSDNFNDSKSLNSSAQYYDENTMAKGNASF
ncbi:MAG: hypothetical protein ACRCVG_03290 [Methanobacteriaceae archaeon]